MRFVHELSDTKELLRDEYIDSYLWLQDALKDLTTDEIHKLIAEINSQYVDLRRTPDDIQETRKRVAV